MTTRVLLVGFEYAPQPKPDELLNLIRIRSRGEIGWGGAGFRTPKKEYSTEGYSTAFFEPGLPTAYDYHIVVVSKEAVYFARSQLADKKDDLVSLMNTPFPGTLVVPIIGGAKNYLDWVPSIDKLKERQGESLKLREKHWAHHFMKKYQKNFSWRAHADFSITAYDDSVDQRFIATNIADNPVALESPKGNGRTIFLPFYDFRSDSEEVAFIRDLLDIIETKYKSSNEKVVPAWASKPGYRLPFEDDLDEQAKAIEQARTSLNRTKSILWLDGIELVNSVAQTLAKLDVRCEVKEVEGRHDIEILEPELHGIMEVKGLKGYANYQDIRQLLDWHVEALRNDENVKGIFLLNDFREIEPELRQSKLREVLKDSKYPFTRDAERIAINNNFCLLTTYQLFHLLKRRFSGNFDKLDFLRKLKGTRGTFQLES